MALEPTNIEEEALLAVLDAFGSVSDLRNKFVLKGGNALRWVYQGSRSSVDLDFSSTERHPHQEEEETVETLADIVKSLNPALESVRSAHRFEGLRVQSSRIRPPNKETREFPALELKVGYNRKPGREAPFPQTIKVEISLNEVVCDYRPWKSGSLQVSVGSLSEIVSEKLRAILQQELRNRSRSSDIYDVWFFWKNAKSQLNTKKISGFLLEKSDGRENVGAVTKSRFNSDEIRRRSEEEYTTIERRLLKGQVLPPFETAYAGVLNLVRRLTIPD